ncbi:MAG TPA: hypothetical protein VMV19_17620 [Xanthobacteraceae bacterium]|nr:hypothetical protein [Xanthobacteraceae bacterium]
MRTYARVRNADGTKTWITISTTASGDSSMVWLVTLCQVLLLNLNESPMFGNYGLPAQQSVMQQVAPDYYISRTQQQFAPYFASLLIAKISSNPPTYNIAVTTFAGASLNFALPASASPSNQIPQ